MKTSFNPNVPPAVRLDAADSSAAPTVAPKRFGVLRREAKDAYIQALTDYAIWFDKKGLETRLGTDVAALAASRLLASASDGLTTELTLDDLRTLRDFHPEDADVVQTTVNLVASTLPEIGTARGGEEDLGAYIREFQSTFDFVNDRGRPSVPTPFSEHLCPSLRSIAGCDWPFDAKLTSLLQQLSDWCREPRNREWPEYLPALALHARLQAAIGSRHEADTEHGDSRALFAPDTGLSKPAAPAARPTLVQKNRDILNKRIAVNESRISWLSYLQRPTRMTPDQANDLRDKIQVLTAQRGVLSRDLANLDTPMRARDSRPQPETPEAPAAGSREPTAVPRSPSRLEGITNPDTAREKTCDQTPQTIRDQRSRPDPDAVLQANLAKIRIRKAGSSAPATRSPKPDE